MARDLPMDLRPGERMLYAGASALHPAELLVIILRVVSKGYPVQSGARIGQARIIGDIWVWWSVPCVGGGGRGVVHHARDEGLRTFYTVQPKLVILDVTMPRRDGWQTSEHQS